MTSADSFDDLLQIIELIDVLPYEVSAKRKESPGEPPRSGRFESQAELGVQFARQSDRLVIRLRMPMETHEADIVADVGVIYRLDPDIDVSTEIMTEFVAKVGVLAAFPFVREAIFGMATRLRITPPILGLIQAPTPESLKFALERQD